MTQIELFDHKKEYLDYNAASQLLGVSVATLRNWVKAKYIKPAMNGTRKPYFEKEDILTLKENLTEGNIDRLKSRANKRNSNLTFIPKEYLHNNDDYHKVERLVSYLRENRTPIDTALLLVSLIVLKKSELLIKYHLNNPG
jgi:Helix-turn-helix domain